MLLLQCWLVTSSLRHDKKMDPSIGASTLSFVFTDVSHALTTKMCLENWSQDSRVQGYLEHFEQWFAVPAATSEDNVL